MSKQPPTVSFLHPVILIDTILMIASDETIVKLRQHPINSEKHQAVNVDDGGTKKGQ